MRSRTGALPSARPAPTPKWNPILSPRPFVLSFQSLMGFVMPIPTPSVVPLCAAAGAVIAIVNPAAASTAKVMRFMSSLLGENCCITRRKRGSTTTRTNSQGLRLEKVLQKSIVRRTRLPGNDMDHVPGDLEKPPFDSPPGQFPRPADLHNSLAQQGHEGRVTGKNPHQAVIRGRHDGVRLALKNRALG